MLGGVIGGAFGLFFLGVCALAIASGVSKAIEPHCTVGAYGTDLNITIKGPYANDACDGFIKGFNQGAAGSSTAYRTTESDGTLMCEYNYKGHHVLVRDRGNLKLYGTMACRIIRDKLDEVNQ